MQKLTYQELYKQMLANLPKEYFIGLHQINLNRYSVATSEGYRSRFNLPILEKESPTYPDIIQSIYEYGLNVPCGTALRTVKPFGTVKKINQEFFRYNPYNSPYYIIVAIPPYIVINDQKYFVGYMSYSSFLSAYLLNKRIPSEYIYGSFMNDRIAIDNFGPKDYYFTKNSNHISTLTYPEQSEFYAKLLKESNASISHLEMIRKEQLNFENPEDNELLNIYGEIYSLKELIEQSIIDKIDYENPGILRKKIRKYKKRQFINKIGER